MAKLVNALGRANITAVAVAVVVVIVLAVVAGVAVAVAGSNKSEAFHGGLRHGSSNKNNSIPRVIWTYWDDGADMPKTVEAALASWQKHCPDWEIIVMNRDNFKDFVPDAFWSKVVHLDSLPRKADFIRSYVMSAKGGVWCDATVFLTRDLGWLEELRREHDHCTFVGVYIGHFTTHPEYPVIENWFFACTPGDAFMQQWRDEFMRANMFDNVDQYVRDVVESSRIDLQGIPHDMRSYLAMHAAAQKVMQTSGGVTGLLGGTPFSMCLLKAEEGPLKYLATNGWNTERALKQLCDEVSPGYSPLIKLRGAERDAFEDDPALFEAFSAALDRIAA